MKVAILGSGAREHVMAKAIMNSGYEVLVVPGNDGIKLSGIPTKSVRVDVEELTASIVDFFPDVVIVGPTEYMTLGVVENIRKHGIKVIGASSKSAMLEADKTFAKEFMVRHNIPTPRFRIVKNMYQLERALKEFGSPYVIKIPTLQGGKGTFILPTLSEALDIGYRVITSGFRGMWSEGLVVEEFIDGDEYAVQVSISGGDYTVLPMVWEYQRLYDGGRGPNTGGMGAVAPVPIDEGLLSLVTNLIEKTLKGLLKENLSYNGFLYIGVMATNHGLEVLEYNVRLGDPESEVVVTLDEMGFVRMIKDMMFDRLPEDLDTSGVSVAVAVVTDNAPYSFREVPISVSKFDDIYFDHVKMKDNGSLWVSGWRPCVVVGRGKSYGEAIKKAYEKVQLVRFDGKYYRTDIGLSLISV